MAGGHAEPASPGNRPRHSSSSQPRQPPRHLPPDVLQALARARHVEWLTLGMRITVLVALYFALGGSQALNAIWLKSLWALWPPAAFLLAARLERTPPTPRFPFGFYRIGSITFLSAGLALTCMGAFLIVAGLRSFIELSHPDLGPIWDHGSPWRWSGWPPIAALAYSIAVPSMLSRARQGLAAKIHDKGLFADATTGRMSWLAGGTAIVGVIGIGAGFWWADFLATLIIGSDILRHGLSHSYTAVCDLIDEVPRRIGSRNLDPLGGEIHDYLLGLDWVDDARVRLREDGRLLTGLALICPRAHHDLLSAMADAHAHIQNMDWRLLDFELVPVDAERLACLIQAPDRHGHGNGNGT